MINLKNISLLVLFGFLVSSISVILAAFLDSTEFFTYFDLLNSHNSNGIVILSNKELNYPYTSVMHIMMLNVAIFVLFEVGGLLLIYRLLTNKKKFNLGRRFKFQFLAASIISIFIGMVVVPLVYYFILYDLIFKDSKIIPRGITSIPFWINYVYTSRNFLDSQFRIKVLITISIKYFEKAFVDTMILFLYLFYFKDKYKPSEQKEKLVLDSSTTK